MRSRSLSIWPLSALYATCSKSLISSLHLRIHQQSDLARRRPQLRVHQRSPAPAPPGSPCGTRYCTAHARVHREVLPDHLVVRRSRRLLRVSRSVPVDHHARPVLSETASGTPRRPPAWSPCRITISSSTRTLPPVHLRHHRTHRVHVEIQRPQQRQLRVRLQVRHVRLAGRTPCRPVPLSGSGTPPALPAGRTVSS